MKLPEIPGGLPRQSFNTEPEVCDNEMCQSVIKVVQLRMEKRNAPEVVREELERRIERVYIGASCDPKVCLPLRRLRKR